MQNLNHVNCEQSVYEKNTNEIIQIKNDGCEKDSKWSEKYKNNRQNGNFTKLNGIFR